ncbi:MAG: flagellar hook-basal body complex protein [Rhodospirillales bacterium]|nr:flagellar hook-basal body complex protein [Rhodospirillales bacterium]
MTLFGALSSGVSGLTAQSSAIGAISDNITNVSTVGYKNTQVDFQTLVTKQTSATFFSAGGVQSKPRQDTGVQGLLASSSSATDIAISGSGFFVVNEASQPTINNEFLFTRAGSFFQDNDGFLRNTAGFFLQAWPTDAAGVVVPANTSLLVPNQNVISTDFLETVNLNRVGGTAAATSSIAIGANLPSNDASGVERKTDVQFFDSLGNATSMSLIKTKSTVDNKWDLTIDPPPGTAVISLEDAAGLVYDSVGQLEFTARPTEGSNVVIDGITYEVDSSGSVVNSATLRRWDTSSNTTIAQDVADLITAVQAQDSDFVAAEGRITLNPADTSKILFKAKGVDAIVVDPSSLLASTGSGATNQTTSFSVKRQNDLYSDETHIRFPALPASGDTIVVNSITYTFQTSEVTADNDTTIRADSTIANAVADLELSIEANDPEFAATSVRVRATNQNAFVGITNDTLVLKSKANGNSYNVTFTGIAPTDALKTPAVLSSPTAISTAYAINFSSSGIPASFNVAKFEIVDFTNGAADMDGGTGSASKITLDLGTVGESNGMTQFGGSFTPVFITQNGSQFGTFAGVTFSADGIVTALFDNGETRPVYKIPIASFVNVNALGGRTGNIWNSTQGSGDPTLRVADNGPAGQIVQSTLEQSTVDIGTEFTKMIVVQRAFSAAAKIITTADEMLEELLRTKR